jgi:hypothetical protein
VVEGVSGVVLLSVTSKLSSSERGEEVEEVGESAKEDENALERVDCSNEKK